MPKFPVDAPIEQVIKALQQLGFVIVRRGNHIAMQRDNADGTTMPLTLPNHRHLKSSTLRAVLLPDDGGNVFVENKGVPIEVGWQGSRRLVIKHKPTPFVSKRQISVDMSLLRSETVTIDYAP